MTTTQTPSAVSAVVGVCSLARCPPVIRFLAMTDFSVDDIRPQTLDSRGGDHVPLLLFVAGVVHAAISLASLVIATVRDGVGRRDPVDIEPRILQRT